VTTVAHELQPSGAPAFVRGPRYRPQCQETSYAQKPRMLRTIAFGLAAARRRATGLATEDSPGATSQAPAESTGGWVTRSATHRSLVSDRPVESVWVGIIGAGRSWTACTISVLSMPRRYTDVIARSACPSASCAGCPRAACVERPRTPAGPGPLTSAAACCLSLGVHHRQGPQRRGGHRQPSLSRLGGVAGSPPGLVGLPEAPWSGAAWGGEPRSAVRGPR